MHVQEATPDHAQFQFLYETIHLKSSPIHWATHCRHSIECRVNHMPHVPDEHAEVKQGTGDGNSNESSTI
jgi:hypothetical protein